ncbi:MAG: ribbon-helix-helix protein, CopG family [Nitrospira sp.]|nr:ribbon-helix-helix protein, CopG family [Nitrospira sp.]
MPVSVRLDEETEELLKETSRLLGITKTKVIRESIKQYCSPLIKEKKQTLYGFIKERIDKWPGSGRGDLAIRHEEILREMLKEKHRRRS